ncbi:hypothetical protein BJ322DRAFT_1048236 [Thelephora terrestris]|uniref:RING-type domain-containing protein n=1 Tax=Thelephora terrestris TaxID=56493 RepID=A0A9P6L9T2_9AGAM|nr:hypothetical protein BJ322DRAFT_1048236 [Thelephora terrestris]
MGSLASSWYTHQYATWNRTRSIQVSPYLARTDSRASRAATAMSTHRPDATNDTTGVRENETVPKDATRPQKKHDTLFGPNIGIVSSGPEWTEISQDKTVVDELTPEIVKSWVAKSKEASQPTTTLQALVNLKRPSLRLSPLTPSAADDTSNAEQPLHAHGLEFEYDCDAPKCGIRVYVVLSPGHPLAKDTPSTSGSTKVSIFDTVADGGFCQMLGLEHGAVLELDNLDDVDKVDRPAPEAKSEGKETNNQQGNTHMAKKKRFADFIGRKSHRTQSISGPALAVVDAEPPASNDASPHGTKEEGVRLIIKLAALDEDGHSFASANEQLTYLHVVRTGVAPPESEEDKRPWIVHVVKREATIGPHTFHLHEIYGLSSQNTQIPHPPSDASHTYPPIAPPTDDEPTSECLVCLSSPREVVLLPCRHLVACRECAVNMVEFGAGGAITHTETEPAPTGDNNEINAGTTEAPGPQDEAPGSTAQAQLNQTQGGNRRKRRAKGWFCPVCRQPYTSLLRITTAAPPKQETEAKADDAREANPQINDSNNTSAMSRLTAMVTRPLFPRGPSRSRAEQLTPSDLERGNGVGN